MKKTEEYRTDTQGFRWVVDKNSSTKYPNGNFNWLILRSAWGSIRFVRYDEIGNVIASNVSLA